jgi:hypothetical protein
MAWKDNMKDRWLYIIFFSFLQVHAFAQLEDYLPSTPAALLQTRKNYKLYIVSHRIKTVSKWRTDSLTKARTLEKFTCFTPEGDTALCYDYTSRDCFKRIVNRDTHGKIIDEFRYPLNDTITPNIRIKYIYSAGRVSETRQLISNGKASLKRETYLYDKSGAFLRVERFDSASKSPRENEIYKYNSGNIISIKFGERDSVQEPGKIKMHVASSVFYEYDDAKRIKSIKYYKGDKAHLLRTESFQYDDIGNLTHYTGFPDKKDWTADMKYDDKRSIITCDFKDAEGKLKRSVSSSYGKNESLSQEIDTQFTEGALILQKNIYKYKYLKDDNISGCEIFNGAKRKGKIAYEYQYYTPSK